MRRVSSIVGSCMVVVFGTAHADPTSVASRGETLVVSGDGQPKVRVKIKTHEMQIGKPSDERPAVIESNCTFTRYPCSLVSRIEITVKGKRLFVPRSAFCDLADVSRADISVGKEGSTLTLVGGDGADSFIVKIEFDATHVKRRTVEGGESGGQLSEETTYHAVVFE
jgi:hypothetical protein